MTTIHATKRVTCEKCGKRPAAAVVRRFRWRLHLCGGCRKKTDKLLATIR